jgi:rSAM/selenodomain-associated transferase 1
MSARHDTRVLVLARAPVAGAVMPHLIPLLGEHGAAALHRSLIEHALAIARESDVGPVELWCAPTTDDGFFQACRERFGASLHRQCGGDLGARMLDAIEDGLERARQVLLIPADCPSLGAADLRAGARALREGRDAVLCPAEHGNYLMVGMTHAMPALFEAMPWGSDAVTEETRQRLRNLGWRWHELPPRWDLHRPEDYHRLVREGWRVQAGAAGH